MECLHLQENGKTIYCLNVSFKGGDIMKKILVIVVCIAIIEAVVLFNNRKAKDSELKNTKNPGEIIEVKINDDKVKQVVNDIIYKQFSILTQKNSVSLLKLRNGVYNDISEYKKNAAIFAKDITDVGSTTKLTYKKIKDWWTDADEKKEKSETRRYIEQMYNAYMFDENKISEIIKKHYSIFALEIQDNYDHIINSLFTQLSVSNAEIKSEFTKKIICALNNFRAEEGIEQSAEERLKIFKDEYKNLLSNAVANSNSVIPGLLNITGKTISMAAGAAEKAPFGTTFAADWIENKAVDLGQGKITNNLILMIDNITNTISDKIRKDTEYNLNSYITNLRESVRIE